MIKRSVLLVRDSEECILSQYAPAGSMGHPGIGVSYKGIRYVSYPYRLVYLQFYGPIPEGKVVRHTCDTPRCINPKHLQIGTRAENSQDMVERGRSCKGTKQPNHILSEQQVLDIYNSVGSQYEIAKQFGVTQTCVSLIKLKKRWRHILE